MFVRSKFEGYNELETPEEPGRSVVAVEEELELSLDALVR